MNASAAAELLKDCIGLDPHSLGSNALTNIVAERMRTLGMTDPRRYGERLADSADELAALIDAVVVPETWFFRGGEVFSFLADHIRRATESASAPTFRVLSAPCSSGEEPYSLVIALVEAGVPRERWTIEGIDVSSRSLSRAQQGLYRDLAFRETPPELKRKYFHKKRENWELDSSLRSRVRFRQGNLLDSDLLGGEAAYDLIFCRNVLIYMHEEARTRVLSNLERLLAPGGLLCMGHAEPWTLFERRFQTAGPHQFFLFERIQATGETPIPPAKKNGATQVSLSISPGKSHKPGRRASRRSAPTSASPAASVPLDCLTQARKEADAGTLDKALQSCQEHLSVTQPSADAYSLLGVIHQARREPKQAVECFRKALYLDPEHQEALLHLSLLYQQSGDEAAAKLLRRRLDRKAAGGET